MDILSDILTTLRLSGTVYFEANFGAPWGMDLKGGTVANFHLVTQGECWYRISDQAMDQTPVCHLACGDPLAARRSD